MEGRGRVGSLKRKLAGDDGRGGSLWSSAPDDILCLVSEKIRCIEEFVRFCAVCRSWYSFGTEHYLRRKRHQFAPLLMLKEDPNSPTTKRFFHNYVSGNKFVLDLPEASGRRCWGSPFGWIVTFGAADLELSLLNPFSRASITLPSLRTFLPGAAAYNPNQRFIKAILTASPESPDCLVVLVIKASRFRPCSKVGFARPGTDSAWRRVEGCPPDVNDVVWFKGGLYACRRTSFELVLIRFQIQPPRGSIFTVLPPALERDRTSSRDNFIDQDSFEYRKYVVESEGELCLVLRYVVSKMTYHFKMFKIDVDTKKWTQISPLSRDRDQCFFVGNNRSFAYTCNSASDDYFKPNLVYYTHDDDLSPFELDEGICNCSISSTILERTRSDHILNPSLWITPCLHFSLFDQTLWQEELHGLQNKKLRSSS